MYVNNIMPHILYVVKYKLSAISSGGGSVVRFMGINVEYDSPTKMTGRTGPLSMRRNSSAICGDIYLTHLALHVRFVDAYPKGPEVPEDHLYGKPIDQRRCERRHPL
jgi:hypothetical protein